MRFKRHKFTLIELLVVIAIFTILITILLPSLIKGRHKTINIVCMNNMRQQGVAILAYSVDNSQRYINMVEQDNQGALYGNGRYVTNPLQRLTKETHAMMDYMGFNQYNRYAKEAAQMMSCPFAFEEYYHRAPTWMRDSDGDGQAEEERRFPLGFVYGITSYQRYHSFYQPKWGVVKRPMIRVGDTIEYGDWANSAPSAESRIIFSDMSGAYKGQKNFWLSNHSIVPGSSSNSYGSDGDAMIKNNFYHRSYTQAGYVTNNYYSANYLYDDLSVKVRNRLNDSNTATGVHVITLPLDSFE